MTGWRVGFCLAHADLIKMMSKIQGQSTSNICSIAQKAALTALNGPDDFVEEMRTAFAARREKALEIVASWPGVVCPEPDGAFYIFPDVSALYNSKIPDSTTACTSLLENAGVAAVPGAAFGDDRCIRFSYALSEESLVKALLKVGEALTGKSG
jgi:aspartate aminotransferase